MFLPLVGGFHTCVPPKASQRRFATAVRQQPLNDPKAKAELEAIERQVAEELWARTPLVTQEEELLLQEAAKGKKQRRPRGRKRKTKKEVPLFEEDEEWEKKPEVRKNPMDVLFDSKLLEPSEEVSLGRLSQALYRVELARDSLLDLCWENNRDTDDEAIEKVYFVELESLAEKIKLSAGTKMPQTQRRRRAKQKQLHLDPVATRAREKFTETACFRRAWAEACGFPNLKKLASTVAAGRAARQALVAANMRLVFSLAKRHEGRGVGFSDLVQEGAIGLMTAAVKLDPERGYKFSTYAFHWIRQAMLRSLACQSRLIRLPMYIHDEVVRLHRQKTAFVWDHAREPSDIELAERLDITPEKVKRLTEAAQRAQPISIHDAVSTAIHRGSSSSTNAIHTAFTFSSGQFGGNLKHRGYSPLNEFDDASGSLYFAGTSKRVSRAMRQAQERHSYTPRSLATGDRILCVGDTLVSTEPNGEACVDLSLMHDTITKVLQEHLDSDERWVIRRRFGLDDGQRRTIVQIADELDQPRSWVKAVEASALRKLKHPHARMLLRSHNDQKDFTLRGAPPIQVMPSQHPYGGPSFVAGLP